MFCVKKRYVQEIVSRHSTTLPPFAPFSTYVSHPLRSSDRCYPYGRDEHIQRDDGSIVTMRALTRRRSSWEQLYSNHIILKVALLYQCHSSTGVGQPPPPPPPPPHLMLLLIQSSDLIVFLPSVVAWPFEWAGPFETSSSLFRRCLGECQFNCCPFPLLFLYLSVTTKRMRVK